MDTQRRPVQPICESGALVNGGPGVRFTVRRNNQPIPAFVVRYGGVAHAFLNRCAHRGVELDWEHGHFFDAQNKFVVCATHGALYDPASGACVAGPCRGGALVKVPITEIDGRVCFVPADGMELA